MRRVFFVPAVLMFSAMLAGCATSENRHPNDPLEPLNRVMFSFNDGVDQVVLQPVATGFKAITPNYMRESVSNVFNNIGGIWGTANAGLQLKGEKFLTGIFRFGVNTIFGFGGVFDIASEMGLDDPQEDFGLTLGHWGVPTGAYIVWPILGPSTARDTVGLAVDMQTDPFSYINDNGAKQGVSFFGGVNMRAQLIDAEQAIENSTIDRYVFTRDVYLQMRQRTADRENFIFDSSKRTDEQL